MGRYTAGGMGRDLLAGAIAGAFGVWVLDRVDWKLYRSRGPEGIRRTEAARPGGMDPAHVIADKLGVGFGDKKDNPAGHTIHYGIGIGMGALYGLLRGMSPVFAKARGGVFGLAMWALQDEALNTALGTAGPPLAYPWQDHVRGAVSHTAFGMATDLIARLLAPWRDRVVIVQGPPLQERFAGARDAAQQMAQQTASKVQAYGQSTVKPAVARGLEDARYAARRLPDQAARAQAYGERIVRPVLAKGVAEARYAARRLPVQAARAQSYGQRVVQPALAKGIKTARSRWHLF